MVAATDEVSTRVGLNFPLCFLVSTVGSNQLLALVIRRCVDQAVRQYGLVGCERGLRSAFQSERSRSFESSVNVVMVIVSREERTARAFAAFVDFEISGECTQC